MVAVDEAYVEAVLSLVERIPTGRVMAYGWIAEQVGTGGPRQVGRVMATHGAAVPWWRVVTASGRLARGHERAAACHLAGEGVALRDGRVDMTAVAWWPAEPADEPDRPPAHP